MFDFGPRLELGSENGKGSLISNIAIMLVGIGLIFPWLKYLYESEPGSVKPCECFGYCGIYQY